ncbi:MAG: RraA family protein [Pseudomonadota bacterium]
MSVTKGHRIDMPVPRNLEMRWRKIPVAVTVDLDPVIRQITPDIRPLLPIGRQPLLFGRAVTVACEPPDFGAVLHGVDAAEMGDILVIAAGGHKGNAMIGDILCGQLRSKDVGGVICDGAIRDVATLATWENFPVYTRHINPRGPIGNQEGVVNCPVVVGDVEITPDDYIMGDDDGLVAMSPEELEVWIDAAEARLELEEEWQASLSEGKTMQEVFSLDLVVPSPDNDNVCKP